MSQEKVDGIVAGAQLEDYLLDSYPSVGLTYALERYVDTVQARVLGVVYPPGHHEGVLIENAAVFGWVLDLPPEVIVAEGEAGLGTWVDAFCPDLWKAKASKDNGSKQWLRYRCEPLWTAWHLVEPGLREKLMEHQWVFFRNIPGEKLLSLLRGVTRNRSTYEANQDIRSYFRFMEMVPKTHWYALSVPTAIEIGRDLNKAEAIAMSVLMLPELHDSFAQMNTLKAAKERAKELGKSLEHPKAQEALKWLTTKWDPGARTPTKYPDHPLITEEMLPDTVARILVGMTPLEIAYCEYFGLPHLTKKEAVQWLSETSAQIPPQEWKLRKLPFDTTGVSYDVGGWLLRLNPEQLDSLTKVRENADTIRGMTIDRYCDLVEYIRAEDLREGVRATIEAYRDRKLMEIKARQRERRQPSDPLNSLPEGWPPPLDGMRFLWSSLELDNESREMDHCIDMYAGSVLRGVSIIASITTDSGRSTVEYARDGKVREHQGPHNGEVPQENLRVADLYSRKVVRALDDLDAAERA